MQVSLKQRAIGAGILIQSLFFGALSLIVGRRRRLILFYPAFEPFRYGGNLKPVFEAMAADPPPGTQLAWLTRSRKVEAELRGLNVRYSWGRPLFALLRADWIILDKNEPRIGAGRQGRFRMVQLWHGTGFKLIALETPGLSAGRLKAFRWHFRHYRMIAANCEEDRIRKARCFDNANVRVLGSPRTDMLMAPGAEADVLAARLGIDRSKRIVSYCPTFRDSGTARPFTAEGWRALDEALRRTGSLMLVKKHRFDKALSVPPGLSHVRDVSGEVGDAMDLLVLTDVLVSDYSSIVTDFVLTGRPIIFYTYDAEAYQAKGARLYYDLFETLPGPFAADEKALAGLIADSAWFDDPAYRARYEAFRARFHAYLDAGSTARTVAAIRELVG